MLNLTFVLLSALPLTVCFFWMLCFLISYKNGRTDQKIMFWFMLTSTLLYAGHFIFFNRLYALLPVSDAIYNFTTIAVYPIYYIYILSLTGEVKPKHGLVLVPALVIALCIGVLYALMPPEVLRNFLDSYEYGRGVIGSETLARACSFLHDLVKVIFAVQIIPILYFGLKRLKEFRRKSEDYFSGGEQDQLRNISRLLIFFVVTSLASGLANLIGRTWFADSELLVAIPSLLFSSLLFAVGYVGKTQKFTIRELRKESEFKSDTVHPVTPGLRQEIDRLMEEKQLYLQPQLKLSDVAEQLNTNRTYIYNALTEGPEKESFSDYVNGFRIRHALELMEKRKEKRFSIEEIIYESGFQSKSTFYAHFKRLTGQTPKEWLQKGQQK